MGIPRFYADWIRNKTKAIKERYEGSVSSLSIDLNGIIHDAAQQVFAYGGYNNVEIRKLNHGKDISILYDNVYHKVTTAIQALFDKFKPNTLVIAVDGVAPLAKINQQRYRRYIAALDTNTEYLRFDSSSISPGTNFMIGLDQHIRQWLITDRQRLCHRVVYSSHLIPGEGEHKILELMRQAESSVYEKIESGIHLFHGADADLYMLSLVSPLSNIWIVREDNRGTSYISIEALKQGIREQLGTNTAIYDFVVMAFFLGNDFVPHIFSLKEVITTLENVIAIYKNNKKPLVTGQNLLRIDFEALKPIVASLAFNEPSTISDIANAGIKHPHPALESSKTIRGTSITVDYNTFRQYWYTYAIGIYPKYDSMLLPLTYNEQEVKDIIQDAVNSYYMTIEWVWLYYYQGVSAINLDWYYPYNFTPLLTDMLEPVINTKHLVESDPVHQFYHPLQQMLMIMSPKSSSIIPLGLGSLMSSSSPLADLYPTNAVISQDGYNTDWQKDIYLPALDPQRIVDMVIPESIPGAGELYPYETALYDDVQESLKRQKRQSYTQQPRFSRKPEGSTLLRPLTRR